jgi:8-oxo-dGTP pyrophosphatase MutT (NUDIX family)
MSDEVRDNGDSGLPAGWSRVRTNPPPRFFRLSQLRRLRECEQVAAVCYRVGRNGIEFLLVQTRGSRWTFPKGSTEPGLTHAQAAALEAFEEAGVHGRMEEASFTRYIHRKRGKQRNAAVTDLTVNAHLCQVVRLSPPPECNRNPTWFPAEIAKQRLREDRAPEYATEVTRVVDRAVNRIQRLHNGVSPATEALSRVQFTVIDSPRRLRSSTAR